MTNLICKLNSRAVFEFKNTPVPTSTFDSEQPKVPPNQKAAARFRAGYSNATKARCFEKKENKHSNAGGRREMLL